MSNTRTYRRHPLLRRVLLLLLVLLTCGSACSRRAEEPILLGFMGELVGKGSVFGLAGRNGAILAIEQVNAHGGIAGHRVRLAVASYQDSRGDAPIALAELEAQGVAAIIGPMTSAASMEIMTPRPLTDLVLFSPTSETSRLAGINDHFFRACPSTEVSVRLLVRHMLNQGHVRRVSLVRDVDNDAFTLDWLEAFKNEYLRQGGSIVKVFTFSSHRQTSFSQLARKVADSGAEGVVLLTHATDTALFCQQIAKAKLKLALFCTSWASSPLLVEMGGQSVESLTWVQGSSYDSPTPAYRDFCRRYRTRFSQAPDYAALHAYEATRLLLQALAGDPDQPLVERLLTIGSVAGPQGVLTVNRSGDVISDLSVLTIQGGRIVSLAHSRMP